MKKQWLIERSRVFEIQPKPGDTWEKLFLVPELKPGQFRSFPGSRAVMASPTVPAGGPMISLTCNNANPVRRRGLTVGAGLGTA